MELRIFEKLTRLRPGDQYFLQVLVEESIRKVANFAVGLSMNNNNNNMNMCRSLL